MPHHGPDALEDRIERQEALDAVLRSLSGTEYAVALLVLEGYSLQEVARHFEWNNELVYFYWTRIKRKGRTALALEGYLRE